MTRPRGLNTFLRVVSKLRRLTDAAPRASQRSGPETLSWPDHDSWPARPNGPLVWVQARRAEDARWVRLFIDTLSEDRGESVNILLTTDDPAQFETGFGVMHQPVPAENGKAVGKFLRHWRPDLGIFLNAPNRPVLISDTEASGTPMFLAATRRAETQVRPRLPLLNTALLDRFERCLAASATDAEALRKQGVNPERVEITGPFVDTSAPLPCDLDLHDRLRTALAGRPTWLIAGASPEDIELATRAHRLARRASHRLVLALLPRETDPGLTDRLTAENWRVADTEALMSGDDTVQIVVGTAEDRALWYRVAPITLTGGSFEDHVNSSDPYEPALLGSAVIHGPATAPYDTRFRRLAAAGGALPLTDPDEIAAAIEYLLAPDRAAEFAHAGWSITSEAAPAIDRLVALANDVLDQREVSF